MSALSPLLSPTGGILPDAVAACGLDDAALAAALGAGENLERAAAAVVAGSQQRKTLIPALGAMLDDDSNAGRAAAWALAALGGTTLLLESAANGKLDRRENAWRGLAMFAAEITAAASQDVKAQVTELATPITALLQAELQKAAQGRTSLAEKACLVLAILGAPGTAEAIQATVAGDSLCDRLELQRLRRAVDADGRDKESAQLFAGSWTQVLSDLVAQPEIAEPAPASAPAGPGQPVAPGSLQDDAEGMLTEAGDFASDVDAEAHAEGDEEGLADEGPQAVPLDWKAFAASPEAAALPPQSRAVAQQLGPMLEQLAQQAVGIPLALCSGQELAGILLQVLPQALPPQYLQAALSPQAINSYQALVKFLIRTGAAPLGSDILSGLAVVRQELTRQIRSRGILGGPDYSDPDAAAPAPGAAAPTLGKAAP